ncbi:MAG: hypothetical protein Q8R96_15385 [Bacteroidota bacterium]|nr:hypothetical protein [Bacteroidota bacterium]
MTIFAMSLNTTKNESNTTNNQSKLTPDDQWWTTCCQTVLLLPNAFDLPNANVYIKGVRRNR